MASYEHMLMSAFYNGTQGHVKNSSYFPIAWVKCVNSDYPDATVAVNSGGDMAFTTNGTTADTTVIASTGIIDMSTPAAGYNTLGEWADTVNGSANWVGLILGGTRDMLTDGLFYTTTEANASGVNGVFLYGDCTDPTSSGTAYYCFAVSAFDPSLITAKPSDGSTPEPDASCQSVLNYVKWLVNASTAGNALLYIYSSTQKADNLIYGPINIDNTTTTDGVLGGPPLYKSRLGERLVIRLQSDVTMASTACTLVAQGYSIDWSAGKFLSGYVLANAAG